MKNVSGVLAELRDANKIQDPREKFTALELILSGVSKLLAGVLLVSADPDDLSSAAAQLLMVRWAGEDPRAAMEWARSLKDESLAESMMVLAATHWANLNGYEAATWARERLEGDLRAAVLLVVGHEVVKYDPLEALRIGSELPDGGGKFELMARAAGDWALADLDGAIAWASKISKPELKSRVFERIALSATSVDLNKAASIAMTHMSHGAEQDRALVSIIERWGAQDPLTAASWVSQFPDDRLGIDAVDNLLGVWVTKDSAAPAEWVLSLPQGPLRESGIRAYVRFLERSYPETAQKWASTSVIR